MARLLFKDGDSARVINRDAKIMKRVSAERAFNCFVHPLRHIFVKVFVGSSSEPHGTDRVTGDRDLRNFNHRLPAALFGIFYNAPLRMFFTPLLENARRDKTRGANGWTFVVEGG